MLRHREAFGWLLGACSLIACDDDISHSRLVPEQLAAEGGSDATPGVDAAPPPHVVPPPVCTGGCCPSDTACATTPAGRSGPECLAQFDNKDQTRWQLRQTWSTSELPIGNANLAVATTLARRSELPWATCNMPQGTSGFIQLVDFDLTKNVGRVGFSTFVTDVQAAVADGLCMVQDTYNDATYALPASQNEAVGADWPDGLPLPMILPWNAAPVQAKGLDKDFDLAAERADILAKFADGGEYKAAGFTGIFYLDKATGRLHGYSPLAYVVVYDTATQLNIIPIREGEITAQLNDPASPNCVGVYRGADIDQNTCVGNQQQPAWGCSGNECPAMQGPNVTRGYFLTTEMEQIYNTTLKQTLSAVYPGLDKCKADGWCTATESNCRHSPKWDPQHPETGLPMGDWCAATNSAADAKCHDAYRSISYATFQGFKIKEPTCPAK